MITLTTPIVQQNATRLEVVDIRLRDDVSVAEIVVLLRSPPAGGRAVAHTVRVANGTSVGIALNSAPSRWDDVVVAKLGISTPTGYDTIEAAYNGASKAARKRGVEQALLTLGVIDASLTGAVA